MRRILFALGCALWLGQPAAAEYRFGYPEEPAQRTLNAAQLQRLQQQGRVSELLQHGDSGEAWLVQDVPLPRRALWRMILDFDHYADRVEALDASREIDQRPYGDGRLIRADYQVSAFFVRLRYRLAHQYRPRRDYMRWTLDPEFDNDLKRVEGYWLLTDHPRRPGWTRAYYGARLTVADWLPRFLTRKLAELGLESTSRWLADAPQTD